MEMNDFDGCASVFMVVLLVPPQPLPPPIIAPAFNTASLIAIWT